jgi:hypothetical protein
VSQPACDEDRIRSRTKPDADVVHMITSIAKAIPKPNPQPSLEELQRVMNDGKLFERNGHG